MVSVDSVQESQDLQGQEDMRPKVVVVGRGYSAPEGLSHTMARNNI